MYFDIELPQICGVLSIWLGVDPATRVSSAAEPREDVTPGEGADANWPGAAGGVYATLNERLVCWAPASNVTPHCAVPAGSPTATSRGDTLAMLSLVRVNFPAQSAGVHV